MCDDCISLDPDKWCRVCLDIIMNVAPEDLFTAYNKMAKAKNSPL